MKRHLHRRLTVETLESRQLLDAHSVLISEIMYNPAVTVAQRGDGWKEKDFEFLELHNAGDSPALLTGASLQDGVSITFGPVTLEAGQYAVVVHNRQAFEQRYGLGPFIVGQYTGTLSNKGDRILFQDTSGGNILDATYDDTWYPETDGGGFSLTIANPSCGWYPSKCWQPSSRPGGSPGYGDGIDDPRPQDLTATVLSARHVALRWSAPDRAAPATEAYRIYRDGRLIGSSSETSLTDATVAPGNKYSYQVAAMDANGEEYLSNPIRVAIEQVGGDLTFASGVSRGMVRGMVKTNGKQELSGLVASRKNQGVLWTHNDGPQTAVYAISAHGENLGTFELQGVPSHDWEDIAIGPGPKAGVDYLYVADIGGKKPKRNVVQVFRTPEPVVSAGSMGGTRFISDYAMITLQYPGGNQFNAETLLSDPRTGDLYVITKEGSGGRVYRAASASLVPGQVVPMELVGQLDFPRASAGDISPSGSEIVIRNEDFAQLFRRGQGQSVADALRGEPVSIPVVGRPTEPNGEGITFDGIGRDYFTISEGVAPPLYFFRRIPTGQAGDANRDQQFDQLDLVMALASGKFRTQEPAKWSEGDWNGDGLFDNLDIVAALQSGNYLRGHYGDYSTP